MNNQPKVKRKDIEEYFYNFKKLFKSSKIEERRELIKTFINSITLDIEEQEIKITPYSIGVRSIRFRRLFAKNMHIFHSIPSIFSSKK